jgi:hypothetical protein
MPALELVRLADVDQVPAFMSRNLEETRDLLRAGLLDAFQGLAHEIVERCRHPG